MIPLVNNSIKLNMNIKIQRAINDQIKEELYSSYLYLSMAAYSQSLGLKGFANWFVVQAKEELDHAMGFYDYLIGRNARVILQEIPKPPFEFAGAYLLFSDALKHEKYITGRIHRLYEMAGEEKDYAFQSFLKWYIEEQVEEESNSATYIDKIKLLKDADSGQYILDQELAKRKYTPISPTAP